MRILAASLLLLGLPVDRSAAQHLDSVTFVRAPVPAPRARAATRRDAELRRRRIDFLDAGTLNPTAPFVGKPKPLWGTTLLTWGDEQTQYVLVRRTVSSVPEVHARWDDTRSLCMRVISSASRRPFPMPSAFQGRSRSGTL